MLRRSRAVLYTPHNEHFGIVPVESMYVGTPVIAVNSGGETISCLLFKIYRKSALGLARFLPRQLAN